MAIRDSWRNRSQDSGMKAHYLPDEQFALSGWSRHWKQACFRSGEPLRHPKARTKSSFSAIC